jgi:hypothetical protein
VSGFALLVSPTTLILMPHSQRHVDTVVIIEVRAWYTGACRKDSKCVYARTGGMLLESARTQLTKQDRIGVVTST